MTFRPHVPTPKAIPTVKIAAPGSESGYVVINESDFDASLHVEYKGAALNSANQAPVETSVGSGLGNRLDSMPYPELQALAKANNINANQKKGDLLKALSPRSRRNTRCP